MAVQSIEVVILPDGRMDRKNAARYLGLSVKTLATHASKGTGPRFIKRGRVWYFQRDCDAWLQEPNEPVGDVRRRPPCERDAGTR